MRTAQKGPLRQAKSKIGLTLRFKRGQFLIQPNTLMTVEINVIIKQATGFGKDPALRSGDARRFEDSYKKAETATSPLFFLSPPRGKSFQLPALHNSRKVPGQCIS